MKARTQWEKARLPAYASMANPYGGVEVMRPVGEADLEDGFLFERVLSRENMARAWAQVRRNKGAPGVDGLSIADFPDATRPLWPEILTSLRVGRYRPQPVRRVDIPKGNGGTRPLGIPTVLDRLIQQALAQVLVPIFDSTFSPWSYGFRPGRSAHGAMRHIADGSREEGRSYPLTSTCRNSSTGCSMMF
jgi:RNA-directed DNA polymerase